MVADHRDEPPGRPGEASMPFVLHAWLDESMHEEVPGVSESMYLLAAAVADPGECDGIRNDLRALLPGKKPRLHWREEAGPLKEKMASTIAGADFCGLVVVGVPANLRKQERARRQCMEAMIIRLQEIGVTQVWIENRTSSLNRLDRRMVDALRSKKILAPGTRVDFSLPEEEPMLWIPDALAGSSGMARKGAESSYRDLMDHAVEEIELLIR